MSSSRIVSDSIVIDSPPERIFDILADPRQHRLIDGSGALQGTVSGPERLSHGARFGMHMRIGLPYRVTNTVIEYDENRRIAWQHLARHTWRYELEPAADGVRVTESWDWSTSPVARLMEFARFPAKNKNSIRATLIRLKRAAEATRGTEAEPTRGTEAEPG
ncbi:MAG: SRPBCC family protein [Geodermatophilaceae bacterium]|nr:SRPBCC family protein [Geodermatophilaceae bacterium]